MEFDMFLMCFGGALLLLFVTSLFIPGMNVFLYLWIRLSYKKIKYESEYYRDILNYTPSEIYYIYNKNFHKNFFYNVNSRGLLIIRFKKLFYINLLKMNLLGYVSIDFSDKDNFNIKKNNIDIVEDEYKMIYNFLFGVIANGDEVRLYDIYNYVENNYNNSFFASWDDLIKKSVLDKGFSRGSFMDFYGDKLKIYYIIFIPILFLVSYFIYGGYGSFSFVVFMFLLFLFFLICGHFVSKNVIKVYSDYSVYEYRKIKALKKFLKDFSIISERGVEYSMILEDYVVYASIFDMIDKRVSIEEVISNVRSIIDNKG